MDGGRAVTGAVSAEAETADSPLLVVVTTTRRLEPRSCAVTR